MEETNQESSITEQLTSTYNSIPVVTFKKRGLLSSQNGRKGIRKKEDKESDEDNEDEDHKSNNNNQEQLNKDGLIGIKRSRDSQNSFSENKNKDKSDYVIGQATSAVYSSTKEAVSFKYGGDATHYSEVDTAIDRDARAMAERNSKLAAENTDGLYHGLNAYKSYRNGENTTTNASGTLGPARAPSFLRSINRFDYQPAICKDYKETGYCGFGDSCIYMHDRGDYKSGWQLEKEWEALQAKKKKKMEEALAKLESGEITELPYEKNQKDFDDDDDEKDYTILEETDLPFACFICREDFKNPVVSTCGHYFCRDCAINSNKTDPKCKACCKPTLGVFNRAIKLEKKLATINSLKSSNNPKTLSSVPVLTSQQQQQQGSWEEV